MSTRNNHFELLYRSIPPLTLLLLAGCDRTPEKLAHYDKPTLTNSIGMELVRISPGEFHMGDSESPTIGGKNSPQHLVKITKPFYIGKYEVTHEQYRRLTGPYWTVPPMFYSGDSGKSEFSGPDDSSFPADNVSWNAAHEYCRKLSDLPEEKAAGRVYRLPSEAEWEYVCRAGTQTLYSFGDNLSLAQANFNTLADDNSDMVPLGRTSMVGSYPPNQLGVYDMHGNVWEWCFGGMNEYGTETLIDPPGEHAIYRVLRGGSWDFPKTYCRSDFRMDAIGGYVFIGFRVVCEIDATHDNKE